MLTVSRPGVETEYIVEHDIKNRFIKLPIENYLKLLTVYSGGVNTPVIETINRPQIALINAINDPAYRFICAALSRRLGKTYIANIIGQLVTLVPNSNVLLMSPNYALSSISFELQRRLIKHFDLEVERDNLKDRVLELTNGSTIRMGSIGQVDSCVGRSYDLIIFDEAALGKDGEEAFNVALRPTLDKPNSKAIFISTPRGKKNWFSLFYNRGFSPEFPAWCSLQADYKENSRMTEDDVAEARRSMSKAEFEQEYMASFVTYEGQIYQFANEDIVDFIPGYTVNDNGLLELNQETYSDRIEFFGGLDPGYRDETAFIIIAYDPDENIFYVVDEYIAKEKTTDKHAEAIKALVEKYQVSTIFIDSAAAQFAADLAYLYDVASTKAKKQVLEGIAYCQTLVDTHRIKVRSTCTNTLDALDQYQWDTNETLIKDRPLHNHASHMMDAFRYALYSYTV